MSVVFQEIKNGLSRYRYWTHLGWSDVKQRYRGSLLGPLWMTMNMAVFILALGIVYSRLFHQNIRELISFLTASLLVWIYITTIITESCDVFIADKDLIENVKLPYSIYIFKLIWRNMVVMLHNSIVYVAVCLIFFLNPHLTLLLFVPGFIIVTLGLFGLSMILGLVGLRYRDTPPIISSLIMVAFLISPITWKPELLGNSLIIKLNPLTYFMDMLRSPLLGQVPSINSYIICSIISISILYLALNLFAKYSSRIAFWV